MSERTLINSDVIQGYENLKFLCQLPSALYALMFGTVADCLVKPRKTHALAKNGKYLDQVGERDRFARMVVEALWRGIDNLHEHGVAHRDIKMENLLVEVSPRAKGFGVDSIKISDLGYSLDFSTVATAINKDSYAAMELPATPPHTSPELLQARVKRKKMVQAMINYAIENHLADCDTDDQKLRTLKRKNASNDSDKKVGDQPAMVELEKLIGTDVYDSEDFRKATESERNDYEQSLAAVQRAPEKLDIFSGAITSWMILHPDEPEPDPNIKLNASDLKRLNALMNDSRPKINNTGASCVSVAPGLFVKLVQCNFFQDAWATEPAMRPSANKVLGLVNNALL